MCPFCKKSRIMKKGFYTSRSSKKKKIQRYYCHTCRKTYSDQTGTLTYRDQKPHLNQLVFTFMCSSVSQRRLAINLGVVPRTIARKITKIAKFSREHHQRFLQSAQPVTYVTFDEMETFEHTKCKPLSIAVAVDDETRTILSTKVSIMPAKGPLAAISRKKYGKRKDDRPEALHAMFADIKRVASPGLVLKSDRAPRYPLAIKKAFENVPPHLRHKGQRGARTGYGELKKIGFDPLFSLNHTCAMIRDNLKRLTRRTWCTTKKMVVLQDLLDIYAHYHNQRIRAKERKPKLNLAPI